MLSCHNYYRCSSTGNTRRNLILLGVLLAFSCVPLGCILTLLSYVNCSLFCTSLFCHVLQLADWWLSYAYLKLRMPIGPYINVCGMGPYTYHYWPPATGTQLPRNAISLYMLLQHWQHIRRWDVYAHPQVLFVCIHIDLDFEGVDIINENQ